MFPRFLCFRNAIPCFRNAKRIKRLRTKKASLQAIPTLSGLTKKTTPDAENTP
jgi:hypothetical protein